MSKDRCDLRRSALISGSDYRGPTRRTRLSRVPDCQQYRRSNPVGLYRSRGTSRRSQCVYSFFCSRSPRPSLIAPRNFSAQLQHVESVTSSTPCYFTTSRRRGPEIPIHLSSPPVYSESFDTEEGRRPPTETEELEFDIIDRADVLEAEGSEKQGSKEKGERGSWICLKPWIDEASLSSFSFDQQTF